MANIEIKTLSAVHVGSGRFLQSKTEYVFGKENIGIVDEAKVLELIGEEKIHHWVNSIEKGQGLVQFLAALGKKPILQQLSARTIAYKCDINEAKNLGSLKEQIHNGQGLPYIPGSSIKGAIRSAIYNSEIRNAGQALNVTDLYKNGRIGGGGLEKKLFGQDPNHDVFRFLQIGDAYFSKNSTVAVNMQNINIIKDGVKLDSSKNQLIEAIGNNKKANSTIRLNMVGMASNKKQHYITDYPESFTSLDILFQTINSNSKLLIGEEIKFWKQEQYDSSDTVADYLENLKEIRKEAESCTDNECVLRLGHGSGYTFITGNLVNQPGLISDDDYNAIVNTSRPGNSKHYSKYFFPKTRRVDEYVNLLGFVKLKIN